MSLYATFGDSRVSAPASVSTLGSQVAAHTRALETMMSQQRDALVHNQFSASQLTTQVSKMSAEAAAQIRPHLEWMERFNTQVNTSDVIPLATAFPRLAEGVQNRDPFEVVRGLDDYGKAMTFERPGHRTLAGRLQGVLVDEQGLMTGLPDAPPLVRLLTPWGTEAGVRIRSSLNRLMVSEQTFADQTRRKCESATQEDCERYRESLASFEETYIELSLIHAIADRMAFAGDAGFRRVMDQIETTTNFYFGAAEGMVKSLGEAYQAIRHPILHVTKIASGLKFAVLNKEAAFNAIKKALAGKWRAFEKGSARERGQIVGKVVTDVILSRISVLKVLKAASRLRVLRTIPPAAKNGAEIVTSVEQLVEKGALPLIAEATEGALDTVATGAKIEELAQLGKLSDAAARDTMALSKVLPKTAAEIVENPKLAETLAGIGDTLAKSKPIDLLQGVEADRQLANLVAREGAEVIESIKNFGADAAVGLAKLETAVPGILKSGIGASIDDVARASLLFSKNSPSKVRHPPLTIERTSSVRTRCCFLKTPLSRDYRNKVRTSAKPPRKVCRR